MLKDNDETHPSLCHNDRPLPGIGDAVAGILPADVQNDGPNIRFEVVIDNIVSLFPVGCCFVVVVVEDLVEPVLFLGEFEFMLGIGDLHFQVFLFFPCGCEGGQQKKCKKDFSEHIDRLLTVKYSEKVIFLILILFIRMNQGTLDVKSIPKFEF